MQYRELGQTGARLSVIGFGGMLCVRESQADANRDVAEAVDRGVTYFDVAPSYGAGEAEERLGPALAPFRARAFLAGKTNRRDAAGAQQELKRTLRRLQTDHLDLYQLHAMTTLAEVEQVFAPRGAMEVMLRARERGETRFLGFSAHSAEATVALFERFPFDSVLCPVNFCTYIEGGFGGQIREAAHQRGAGVLALKAMARTAWPAGTTQEQRSWRKCWYEPLVDRRQAELALRFTLGLGVTAAIPPGHREFFAMALDLVSEPRPLSDDDQEEIHSLAGTAAPLFTAAA